ncbi:unnamed protein product [Urochloa humidicola]
MIEADITVDECNASGFTFGRIKLLRKVNNCYIPPNQALPAASDSSPCAPLTFSTKTVASKEQNDNSYPSSHIVDASIPTLFSTSPPPFDTEVIDLSAFIRNKYQEEVDDAVLNDIKYHNARCLQHIHKFTRGLTASLVKENSNLAVKFIEHLKKKSDVSPTPSVSKAQTRCRTYDEMLSGAESGNEGQNHTSGSKLGICKRDIVLHTKRGYVFVTVYEAVYAKQGNTTYVPPSDRPDTYA